ncbi:2-iminobutanoate/2-iminopropanoate deaminase-like isoform X2 [Nothobranchius furzeri]|uniref:2-iminobutanoate/2-iminopropanoate deaminase-like isoform X2 n=1 Tax=Nothobranchius furzeri TaxID=105023 RepID=UPI00390476E6
MDELRKINELLQNSQAVVVDRSVDVSGQLGMDPVSGQLVGGSVQAQTRQALVNMGKILRMAGCTYENGEAILCVEAIVLQMFFMQFTFISGSC